MLNQSNDNGKFLQTGHIREFFNFIWVLGQRKIQVMDIYVGLKKYGIAKIRQTG